jgi:hypothetical protein
LEKHKVEFERLDVLKGKLREVVEEWDRKNPREVGTVDEVEDDTVIVT